MKYAYQCLVYLADGLHVSQVETCPTKDEAVARAEAWRAVGHKAQAFLVAVDMVAGEIRHTPLD